MASRVAQERADRRRVPVPGRRRDGAPAQLNRGLDRRGARLRAGGVEHRDQRCQRLAVRAARLLAQARLREERIDGHLQAPAQLVAGNVPVWCAAGTGHCRIIAGGPDGVVAGNSPFPATNAHHDPAKTPTGLACVPVPLLPEGRVAEFARAGLIESRVEFEAGPAANNLGPRAVLRRHALRAARQRTLEATRSTAGPVLYLRFVGHAPPFDAQQERRMITAPER